MPRNPIICDFSQGAGPNPLSPFSGSAHDQDADPTGNSQVAIGVLKNTGTDGVLSYN